MIFHRCDRCNKELPDEERNQPFIRVDSTHRLAASIMVVNDRGKSVEDLCGACKLEIILHGTPSHTLTIPHDPAHLHPLPAPVVAEALPPQAAPAPVAEEPLYEPSVVTDHGTEAS